MFHNNTIEQYSIVEDESTKVNEEENKKSKESESLVDKIDNPTDIATVKHDYSPYRYTPEQTEEFFASSNGQTEDHNLEDSICRPLIGIQSITSSFLYCKLDPKVENINLKSIEDHIRLKDPERHKEKLLELAHKEEAITQQQSEKEENELFECYYCIIFPSTKDKNEYQNHVKSNHRRLPAYPSIADIKSWVYLLKERNWKFKSDLFHFLKRIYNYFILFYGFVESGFLFLAS
jgi:hypothetical protein